MTIGTILGIAASALVLTVLGIALFVPPPLAPHTSDRVLRERLTQASTSVEQLSPSQAIDHMLAFYRDVRTPKCRVEDDGDMLLFQWGTHDFGRGETFRFDLTRQFVLDGTEGSDGMSQLSLTLHFPPSDSLRALKSGNRWCKSPQEITAFEEFVRASDAYRAANELKPSKSELKWGQL